MLGHGAQIGVMAANGEAGPAPMAMPGGAQPNPKERKDTCFKRYLAALVQFEEVMTDFFGELGLLVATHPRRTQLGVLLVTALACLGFFNAYFESKPQNLWVLTGGRSVDDLAYVEQVWGVARVRSSCTTSR
jgi:hypothetical protein